MNMNPLAAYKKLQAKIKNKGTDQSDTQNAHNIKQDKLNKAKANLPFTFRGLEEISSAWVKLGIRGAILREKVIITSSKEDFYAFNIRIFFDTYNKGATININPQGFPGCTIICLDKNKKVITQLLVDSDTVMFAVTKSCRYLTIKGAK